MPPSQPAAGYFRSGLPYDRLGHGPRPLVVVQSLTFENKPQPSLATSMYRFLGRDYTVFSVVRKPGLPQGYTLTDMTTDYAAMIRAEFGGPVDVIGISTGGAIVQPLAADPSDLVITILAEDQFAFKDQFAHITAPTLVIAGDRDPFYPPALFRETAAGIPKARLCLYEKMGRPAVGKQCRRDVLAFLRNE
jgi:pimeloyl-ACP methyl ester carboxylesterase